MKHTSLQSPSLALAATSQPRAAGNARDLERLRLLVPDLAHTTSADIEAYALAYIERYQGDLLQLEQEWAFLTAALAQARQREAYAVVVRLVAGLAHPASRLADLAEAEHILRLGVEASRRTRDQAHLAAFSNRLSGLLFARGKYQEGWQLWNSSLELARSVACAPGFWEPLASFAYIADAYLADMQALYGTPARFQPILESACQSTDPDSFVVARFARGFYARLMNDLDQADEDLSACLRALARQASDAPLSPHRQLLMLVAQAELARAQGDYARSQHYTEAALALAQVFSDCYTVAALLIDQGLYTLRQRQFADMRATYLRLRALALQTETPRVHNYSRLFGQLLAEHAPVANAPLLLAGASASPALSEPISEREREVLELVAAGFSNQDIARRLVITRGTVKKHLEHIYTKLDVHSRTAALARARQLHLLD
jgi:ATP/maltotriose-dependent transcriptional regulator MalT